MFDFNREYEIATHPKDRTGVGARRGPAAAHQQSGHPVEETRARAVVINQATHQFLAVVNNRVTPGSLTVMVPGGPAEGGDLRAMSRALAQEVGLPMQLGPDNCRFLLSRTYEFPDGNGGASVTRINFYAVASDGAVPRNLQPDAALSVSWMSLSDLRRYLSLDTGGWKIQLGAMDAIEAALDPAKAKVVENQGREVARQDGGAAPAGAGKPTPLPYTP